DGKILIGNPNFRMADDTPETTELVLRVFLWDAMPLLVARSPLRLVYGGAVLGCNQPCDEKGKVLSSFLACCPTPKLQVVVKPSCAMLWRPISDGMSPMQSCPACGTCVSPAQVFCSHCGSRLRKVVEAVTTIESAPAVLAFPPN